MISPGACCEIRILFLRSTCSWTWLKRLNARVSGSEVACEVGEPAAGSIENLMKWRQQASPCCCCQQCQNDSRADRAARRSSRWSWPFWALLLSTSGKRKTAQEAVCPCWRSRTISYSTDDCCHPVSGHSVVAAQSNCCHCDHANSSGLPPLPLLGPPPHHHAQSYYSPTLSACHLPYFHSL